jgi:hypothetical protein
MPLDFPLSSSRLTTLRNGLVVVPDSPAVFRVEGSGALTCLQGLLTCDLAAAGDGSLSWGAVLTAKGMIAFDAWTLRDEDGFTLIAESSARSKALDLFRRTLPPRLATVTDLSESHRVTWLLGPSASAVVTTAMASKAPEAGRTARIGAEQKVTLAVGNPAAPFALLLVGPTDAVAQFGGVLLSNGGVEGTGEELAAARILAGWPTLGREIDDKTLPHEVRFVELGGVSFTKGCYTGQETVARIQFRGQVNRTLRGVIFEDAGAIDDRAIRTEEKPVGMVRSALLLDQRVVALAMIRREIETGASLSAGGRGLRVMELPLTVMGIGA